MAEDRSTTNLAEHRYAIPQVPGQPAFAPRKLRIVAIGAGFANLTLAYKHKNSPSKEFLELAIYEKNPDIGGTWYENTYPGVACDVPAHIYCFPFAPNPNWSSFYVSGGEIQNYILETADKFGLRENVSLNSKVTSAIWSDQTGRWTITIEQNGNVVRDEADILVNGGGFLNRWQWPDIPGIEKYQGELIHSAHWRDIDWAGKRVGIIGNGSSAIQILPQMQPTAKSIDTYIRTPSWFPGVNYLPEFTPGGNGQNFSFSEEEKQRWREHPETLKELRQKMEHAFNWAFLLFYKDSGEQFAVRQGFEALMKAKLAGNPELSSKLIPDWPVGCRRITPGEGYLEALQAENVKPRFEKIVGFTEKGIMSQPAGDVPPEEAELDIVVCATGFDVSFKPGWEMKGLHGADLHELWKDDQEAYMGIHAPQMPNYFTFMGPNSPISHGCIFGALDATADYILRWSSKIAREGIKSVVVKPEVLRDYNDYSQEWMQQTVWATGCRSWYKNAAVGGKIRALYPGSILHFRAMVEAFRTEDFDMSYIKQNRFAFMGNGLTELEAAGGNLGSYLQK